MIEQLYATLHQCLLHLGDLLEEPVGLLPRKVEARLANLPPLLALRFGTKAGGGTVILPRLTHEELAGLARERTTI